jgi:hypothetical protein
VRPLGWQGGYTMGQAFARFLNHTHPNRINRA